MATYNPYNAVKSISDLKGKYHTAKELGGDYKQYQDAAVQYYDELAKNGHQSVADELAASDYIKAQDILSRYKADTTVDDFYGDVMKIGTGEKSPANEQYFGWLKDIQKISTGEKTPQTSETVSGLLGSWQDSDDVRVDLTKDHYKTGKDQLDYINNFDYTEQPYYKPIMETYNLYGDDAADGALAVGAGANGGNIDSYAAANANRQQLAFTNAGHQAALAAAQQNQDNWLDLYGLMGGNITDMGAINAQNLGTIAQMYGMDSAERQNAMNTIYGMYGMDSAERQNALNNGTNLLLQDKQNEIEKYLADIGLEGTKYTTDAEVGMNKYNTDAQVGMNRDDNATSVTLQGMQNEIEKYLGDLGYSSDLAGYASQERMNTADNDAAIKQLLEDIKLQKALTAANNSANLTLTQKEHENALELADREHANALELLDRENKYSGAAGVLKTTIESEVPYYMELVGKDPALSSVNDVRALLLEEYGASNKDTIDDAINAWLKYNKTTNSDSGASPDVSGLLSGILADK